MSLAHGLNKQTTTIANATAYGSGWGLDAQGQLTTASLAGYEESSVRAVVQPLGSSRRVEGPGPEVVGAYKLWLYAVAGVFPTVRGGPDLPGTLLPTLILWRDHWYEVQKVKDWSHGNLPHIYAEATLLGLTRPAAATTAADSDTLVY